MLWTQAQEVGVIFLLSLSCIGASTESQWADSKPPCASCRRAGGALTHSTPLLVADRLTAGCQWMDTSNLCARCSSRGNVCPLPARRKAFGLPFTESVLEIPQPPLPRRDGMMAAAVTDSIRSSMAYRGRDRRRAVAMDVLDKVQSVQQLGAIGVFSHAGIHIFISSFELLAYVHASFLTRSTYSAVSSSATLLWTPHSFLHLHRLNVSHSALSTRSRRRNGFHTVSPKQRYRKTHT